MNKFLSLSGLLVLLAACSSSPSPVLPPVELTDIKDALHVRTLWTNSLGHGVSDKYLKLKPVFSQGIGYSVDHNGLLSAFDVKEGTVKWQRELNLPVAGGLSLQAGMLLLGTSQGEVLALRNSDGSEMWRAQLSSEVLSQPQSAKDMVVVRTVDGKLYGLDAKTGQRRWIYDRNIPLLTLRGNSSPVIVNDMVITGTDSGKLAALTLKNGTVLWETAITVPRGRTELERIIDIDADPVVVGDAIYVVSYQGRLAAVSLDAGRMLWARDFSSYSGMAVDAYRVYITDAEGQAWALNRFNGATLWRQDKLLRRALTAPALLGVHMIVADFNGYVHWLKREDGALVARKRLNEMYYFLNEDYDETDLTFSKSNNVLINPIALEKMIVAVDRLGNMSAFQLEQE